MSNQNDLYTSPPPAGESMRTVVGSIRRQLYYLHCRLGSDAGAGMAEYTFLLLLVALPLVLVFPNLATAISAAIQRVINAF